MRGCVRRISMQDSKQMSGLGAAPKRVDVSPNGESDHLVVSIRLIPPLPYSTTVIQEDQLSEAIVQASRERRAKEREAALNGKAE